MAKTNVEAATRNVSIIGNCIGAPRFGPPYRCARAGRDAMMVLCDGAMVE